MQERCIRGAPRSWASSAVRDSPKIRAMSPGEELSGNDVGRRVSLPQRTLLDQVISERRWTSEDAVRAFEAGAAASNERATLTVSQLKRWRRGEVTGLPRPSACRVAEVVFGHRIEELLGPPRSVGSSRAIDIENVATAGGVVREVEVATEDSAEFVRRGRGTVDDDVLEQLEADVRRLAVEYLTVAPPILLPRLLTLRGRVFGLLEERQRPRMLPSLYRVAGRISALVAHAGADLGHAYAAETHSRTAWLCADLAEDDGLRAYTRWVQSNVAYWSGDYRRAADLAMGGEIFATTGTSALRLASQRARAWSAMGDRREVERALARAQAQRDRVESTSSEPGVMHFSRGKAAYYASEVRLGLSGVENARHALADAEEALQIFSQDEPDACREFVVAAQLDSVAATIELGDVDAAEEQLLSVLALPVDHRTVPVVERVRKVRARLARRHLRTAGIARSLDDAVQVFVTEAPVPRLEE